MNSKVASSAISIAITAMILGFRIKEVLENDAQSGDEITVDSLIHSERMAGCFDGPMVVSEAVKGLMRAALVGISELYPDLLLAIQTSSDQPMFIRSPK